MKLTPKRKRSDSAAAAIAATQAAALPPLSPPAHVLVPDGARPFWDAIVQARPRDTWNPVDMASAANLARVQFALEAGAVFKATTQHTAAQCRKHQQRYPGDAAPVPTTSEPPKATLTA